MKNVLILGGAGSFGVAFTKFLIGIGTPRICILSRDEHKHAAMRQALNDHPALRFFLGDVRDYDRLVRAMRGVDVVVHAAAMKRIEACHYDPDEMIKSNVIGTMNAVNAAQDAGVEKYVYLSTDKAYQSVSAYGHSKALAEALVLAHNNMTGESGTRYACTRYGNVFNSNGSVVPKWQALLKAGKKLPVSNPECTRFFMWMHEAVDLVADTLREMKGGELRIPVLPAYRVGDLAEAMGGETYQTGLPSFEKLHESMGPDNSSDAAPRLTVDELREALKNV